MKYCKGFIDAVGNTPLIRLSGVSEETGCEILGKAEFLNPSGSVKDRAAKFIVLAAEAAGELVTHLFLHDGDREFEFKELEPGPYTVVATVIDEGSPWVKGRRSGGRQTEPGQTKRRVRSRRGRSWARQPLEFS